MIRFGGPDPRFGKVLPPEKRSSGGGRKQTIPPEVIREIRARRAAGEPLADVAARFGFPPQKVSHIATRQIYRSVA